MKTIIKRLFSGRINRRNWIFGLISSIGIYFLVLGGLGGLVRNTEDFSLMGIAYFFIISILIFNISLHVRRIHDTGNGGWKLLMLLIPGINIFGFCYLAFKSGENGDNKYGNKPTKEINYPKQIFGFN